MPTSPSCQRSTGRVAEELRKHPDPFIRGDGLIGLAAQFLERGEDRAQHNLKQRGVLAVYLNVLLDRRQETRQESLESNRDPAEELQWKSGRDRW